MKKALIVGFAKEVIRAVAPLEEWQPLFWMEDKMRDLRDLFTRPPEHLVKPQHWQPKGLGKHIYQDVKRARFDDFSEIMRARCNIRKSANTPEALLAIFDEYFDYFSYILAHHRIEIVLFDCIPHLGPEILLYEIARQHGIETVMFYQSLFPNKYMYCRTLEELGRNRHLPRLHARQDFLLVQPEAPPFYMSDEGQKIGITFFFKELRRFIEMADTSHIFKVRRWQMFLADVYRGIIGHYFIRRAMRGAMVPEDKDFEASFIYFPLHLQPEMTTCPLGGVYYNQLLAIEQLARILPPGWKIYVKENPKQGQYARSADFYAHLKSMANIVLLHPDTSSFRLIKHCKIVATITGTAGWEALQFGKKALVFGYAWYRELPGVIEFHPQMDLCGLLADKPQQEQVEEAISDMLSRMPEGVLFKPYRCLVKNFDPAANTQKVAAFLRTLVS